MEASVCAFWIFSALCLALGSSQHVVHQNSACRGVYYDRLGCFSNFYPFNNTHELPQNPDFVDTTFHLYTRSNPHAGQALNTRSRPQDLGGSDFNPDAPVKILIHGFLQNGHSPWILEMTRTLLERDDINVITLDWGAGAGFPYSQAAANTRVVGAETARLISLLKDQRGVSIRKFHLIGHSLGSHVAGHAGRTLGGRIERITGLDPADPNFSYQPPEVRLDPTDARWVDVIHTDGAPFTTYGGFGTFQAMGHIDFYPNGGKNQPGCHTDTSVYAFMRDAYQQGMLNAEYAMACSHDRSIHLFLQSIRSSCPFTAYPCASEANFRAGRCMRCGNRPCPSMGYRADLYKRTGTYYLDTMDHLPFCGYHYLVRVTLAEDMTSVNGQLHVQVTGDRGQTAPLLLYDGDLSAGQVISSVLLASEDVRHVTSATLTFTSGGGYLGWLSFSTPTVDIASVMVEGVNRRNTLYFCPSRTTVQPGQPLRLNSGTRTPGNCFQH